MNLKSPFTKIRILIVHLRVSMALSSEAPLSMCSQSRGYYIWGRGPSNSEHGVGVKRL